jgi:hypothetical protein
MKERLAGICALALLFLVSSQQLVQAQAVGVAKRDATLFGYDARDEVTIGGTVSSVLVNSLPGMIPGAHLMLATPSGPIDISLGLFSLPGKGSVNVAAGRQVDVTGVVKRFKDKPVVLARIVRVGKHVYAIRNEHGVPISPRARERAQQRAAQTGETL